MVARELLIQFETAAVTFRRTLDLLLEPDGNSSSMAGGLSGNVQIGDSDRQMLQYLRHALEADVLANALTDQTLKEQWREIACGYRNLAQARLTNAETLEQPSPSATSPCSSEKLALSSSQLRHASRYWIR
jgi:hypothetical protein